MSIRPLSSGSKRILKNARCWFASSVYARWLLATSLALLPVLSSRGGTYTWTNSAGGNWSVASNWSPNGVPGQLNALASTDDVMITNAGTYTVVLDVGPSPSFWDIRSLRLGGPSGTQTLATTNKILYVAPLVITNGGVLNDVSSSFHAVISVQNGGTLSSSSGTYFANPLSVASGGKALISGNVSVQSGGSFENDGTLTVNGTLTLLSAATNGGTTIIASNSTLAVDQTLVLLGPLTNAGALTLENSGALSLSNNQATTFGGVVNQATGTINLNNIGIAGGNNHEYLLNQGAIYSANGGHIQGVPGFTNSGAITVIGNTLVLDSGLHLQAAGSLNIRLNSATDYGKVAVSGATALTGTLGVSLNTGYTPKGGEVFQPLTYSSYSGAFTATNLPSSLPWQVSFGPAALSLTALTKTLTWTNTAGGTWSSANNWSPNFVPGGSAYGNTDDVLITNAGTYTVTFDEGTSAAPYYMHSLTLGAGNGAQTLTVAGKWLDSGILSINAGAQVNSTASYWFNNWITPLSIAAGGSFNSTNDLYDQDITVNPGGVINAVNSTNGNGTLHINGNLNVPSGAFVLNSNGRATNSGTLTVASGANLVVNNALTLTGAGGLVTLPGGVVTLNSGHGLSSDNGTEYISNQGTLVSAGGYIQSIANFTNTGTINVLTNTLSLDASVRLAPSGSLNMQLGSAASYGKLAINGNAALAGTFGVTLGYAPAAGDTFTPLSYTSYSGGFSGFNLPALGPGQSWVTTVGATGVTLMVTETLIWTNTAGGNWSTASNWYPNRVPGVHDDVAITTPGTYTVVMDSGTVNIHTLTLGAGAASGTQTLVMSSKTLYVSPLTINAGGVLADTSSTFHAVINVQSGGVINSTNNTYFVAPLLVGAGGQLNANGNYAYETFHGDVVVGAGGLMSLDSGGIEFANDSSLTIQTNGEADLVGGAYLEGQGPVTNAGTFKLIGNNGGVSQVALDNDGTANYRGGIRNLPSGSILMNGVANGYSRIGSGYGSSSYFYNQGTIVVSPAGAQCSIGTSLFDNTGGAVTNSGGTLPLSTFANVLGGTFYTPPGSTIQLQGGTAAAPLKPGQPLVLAGGGNFYFMNGWIDLTNDIIPNLQLVSGVLELEPTFQGGAITNLALNGNILLTNLALPVTGTFGVTNATVYGNCVVQSGGQLIAAGNVPTFHGNVNVLGGGLMTAAGCQFASDASLTVAANGTVYVSSGTPLFLYGPMTNWGTVTLSGAYGSASEIYLGNDGSPNYAGALYNMPGGTINLVGIANGYSIITGSGSKTYFGNRGVLVASPGSSACGVDLAVFDNGSGVVSNLVTGGTLNLSFFTNTLTGTFYATNGAAITFRGGTSANPMTPGTPLLLAGAGNFYFNSGWLTLPVDNVPHLQLVGGTLQLGPGFQGGAITNLGLNGITLVNLNLPVTNGIFGVTNSQVSGSCVVQRGGQLLVNANGITPAFHGSIDVQGGGVVAFSGGYSQISPDCWLTLETNAQMNLANTYLSLQGLLTNAGTLNLSATPGTATQILIYNDGTPSYQGGIWNLPSGILSFLGIGNGYCVISSGYGSGTYVANLGSIVAMQDNQPCSIDLAHFTNSGAVTALKGLFQLKNNITLQPTGSLNVRLNSKTDYGQIGFNASVALTGGLGATLGAGYAPAVEDSFQPVSYPSYSGVFTATNLPSSDAWQTTYGGSGVTIAVTQAGVQPTFAGAGLFSGNLVLSGSNGISGNTYWVLSSTNLLTPLSAWLPVVTNTFDANGRFSFTNTPDPAKRQQFFLLKLP